MVQGSAVLHARAADHRRRAGLRPHHVGDRRRDDRLVRHGDALLRHAEGTPRPAEPGRREGRRHRLQDRRPRRRPGQGPSACARVGRCAVEGALRLSLGGSVQPGPRPGDRALVSRRDDAGRRRQGGALLLDVRAEVLLDGADAAGPRLRGARDGREVARVQEDEGNLRKDLMTRGVRHFVAAAALLAAVAYTAIYSRYQIAEQIHSDGYSYYVYLPSLVIYHDPTLTALADDWYGGPYPDFTGIRRWPSTGRWLNLHPIGTAILMAPFFIVADLLTRWSNLPRDGFSLYYQHGAAVPAIVYLVLGLALLRSMLRRQFSDGVVLATLIGITWGTNLFHYAVYDGTFSHVYAFFTIAVWLWLIERWWDRPALRCSLAIGIVAALNFLIRHTNATYLLVLPLYGITRWRDVAPRLIALW